MMEIYHRAFQFRFTDSFTNYHMHQYNHYLPLTRITLVCSLVENYINDASSII